MTYEWHMTLVPASLSTMILNASNPTYVRTHCPSFGLYENIEIWRSFDGICYVTASTGRADVYSQWDADGVHNSRVSIQ